METLYSNVPITPKLKHKFAVLKVKNHYDTWENFFAEVYRILNDYKPEFKQGELLK